ncbi:MAG: antitoxin [Candidatus Limnocylindrales bacterium]
MRTTVTIDADLDRRLREVAQQRRISYKAAINAAIRAGLAPGAGGSRSYREKVRPLGLQPGVDLTKALDVAAALEDAATIQKLALRK